MSVTINSDQAEVVLENLIDCFVKCISLRYFFTSKSVYVGKEMYIFFFQVKGFIIIIDSGLLRIFPTVNVEKIVSFEPLALSCFEKQRRKSTVRQCNKTIMLNPAHNF